MKAYKIVLIVLAVCAIMFIAAMLSSCAPSTPVPVASAPQNTRPTVIVVPVGTQDNGKHWSGNAYVPVDERVYHITIIVGEFASRTEVHAQGYASQYGNGYGYASMRMWQDGKGILSGKVVSLEPQFSKVQPGDGLIIKTTDLKAMGIPDGAKASFICNMDAEPISPPTDYQTSMTTEHLTYEMDYCRMVDGSFVDHAKTPEPSETPIP